MRVIDGTVEAAEIPGAAAHRTGGVASSSCGGATTTAAFRRAQDLHRAKADRHLRAPARGEVGAVDRERDAARGGHVVGETLMTSGGGTCSRCASEAKADVSSAAARTRVRRRCGHGASEGGRSRTDGFDVLRCSPERPCSNGGKSPSAGGRSVQPGQHVAGLGVAAAPSAPLSSQRCRSCRDRAVGEVAAEHAQGTRSRAGRRDRRRLGSALEARPLWSSPPGLPEIGRPPALAQHERRAVHDRGEARSARPPEARRVVRAEVRVHRRLREHAQQRGRLFLEATAARRAARPSPRTPPASCRTAASSCRPSPDERDPDARRPRGGRARAGCACPEGPE